MLFSRWGLRKLCAFSRSGLRTFCFFFVLLFCCFVCFFFPTWNSRTCGFAYLFVKSFTFACGWEKLSVIVRVTFSCFCFVWFGFCFCFVFVFFSLPLFYIIEWTCSSFSLRKADVSGRTIGGKKL